MKPRKTAYVAHRWLGLVVSVQLLAWSLGGLVFSVLDIREVRGELDAAAIPARGIDFGAVRLSPGQAVEAAAGAGAFDGAAHRVELRARDGGADYVVWSVGGEPVARVDAVTGEVRARLSREEAVARALADFAPEAGVRGAELIEREPPLEYRGRPLPAWRVELDHAKNPRIYIDAVTGDVAARRNRAWRVFDFFWMLHIMDYTGRENFNHALLTAMSVLAVCTSASGLVLWGWRVAGRRRRGAGGG